MSNQAAWMRGWDTAMLARAPGPTAERTAPIPPMAENARRGCSTRNSWVPSIWAGKKRGDTKRLEFLSVRLIGAPVPTGTSIGCLPWWICGRGSAPYDYTQRTASKVLVYGNQSFLGT